MFKDPVIGSRRADLCWTIIFLLASSCSESNGSAAFHTLNKQHKQTSQYKETESQFMLIHAVVRVGICQSRERLTFGSMCVWLEVSSPPVHHCYGIFLNTNKMWFTVKF